jgi:DNA-binding NarL/FixJ family response regulator
MNNAIKIFIADDHRLVLDGLATLIESIDGFTLGGKFNSGRDLIDALDKTKTLPDICLVDIEMKGMDGIETVKLIRQKFPLLKIMALTMHEENHFVNRMITAGANGYVLKNIDRDVFEKSIHRILNNERFFTAGINEDNKGIEQPDDLTSREKQLLKLIVLGKSNKEIAEELFISDRTVDTHRTNIKRKLKISSLAQLIQYAKDHGYM